MEFKRGLESMQKELLEDIRINRKHYAEKILKSIKDDIYEYERYKVNFSLAIGATGTEVDIEGFAALIRETDKFIILSDHLCCMVFPFTDAAEGVKAASNLLSTFEIQFFSAKIYIAVVNAQECSSPGGQVERLFDILKYSIENAMENIPLDNTSF